MKVEVHNHCADFASYRAARVKSLFNAETGANFDLVAEIPDDPDWQIGVVVGPSGSGKTSIGRALWGGEAFYEPDDWPGDRPIVDCISPEGDFDAVTGALAQVGLGDVPAWLRPYPVLSTGQKSFGAAAAELVAGLGHELVGVSAPAFSEPFAHLREGQEVDGVKRDRLRAAADLLYVPWTDSRDLRAEHVPRGTDVILAAHSHAFVGRVTRARAQAAVGYHPSLLPLHRGRDAIRWALYNGERVLGGSVYHLTDTVDAGPLAAQDYVIVRGGAGPSEVWREQLFPLGLRLLREVLEDIAGGRVGYTPQDEALATWEPSWERPPLHRPELPELPPIGGFEAAASGVEFVSEAEWRRGRA